MRQPTLQMQRVAGQMTPPGNARPPQSTLMGDLTTEQQTFVLYQIRNWLFGHHGAFRLLNAAWAAHGAEAYFWE